MEKSPYQPATVTKPIQLLSAWLIGLIVIDASFLGAARIIENPDWAAGVLVVAAIANVPVFLACLFLLQTRFRPEMQEDTFYSEYLKRKSSQTGRFEKIYLGKTSVATGNLPVLAGNKDDYIVVEDDIPTLETRIEINDLLPQYEEIRKEIEDIGLDIYSKFGSTSVDPRVPKNFVVAFGPNCSIPILQEVLNISKKHGAVGVSYLRDGVGFDDGRIYIGAYSYDEGENKYHKLSDALVNKLLKQDLDEEELKHILFEKDIRVKK